VRRDLNKYTVWEEVVIEKLLSSLGYIPEVQICDWPSRVKVIRPECRGEGEPVIYHHTTRIGPSRIDNSFSSGQWPASATGVHSSIKTSKVSNPNPGFDLKGLTSFLSDIATMTKTELRSFSGNKNPVDVQTMSVPETTTVEPTTTTTETTTTTVMNDVDVDVDVPTKNVRKTVESEDKKQKVVLPLANGQFLLDTLSVYTPKNKTNLKPDKNPSSLNLNSNFIKVNILKS